MGRSRQPINLPVDDDDDEDTTVVEKPRKEDWEGKYKGLKSHSDKQAARIAELIEQKEALESERDTEKRSRERVEAERAEATKQWQQTESALAAKIAKFEASSQIRATIASKPEWVKAGLLADYDQGLLLGLDSLDDKALPAHLDKVAARLANTAAAAAEEANAGTVPTPSSEATIIPPVNTEEIRNKMMAIANPDDPEYVRLKDLYLDAVTKEERKKK